LTVSGSTYEYLSEEDVVTCSSAEGNVGCNGGTHYWAFDYIAANGISAAADVPYTATDATCTPAGTLSSVALDSYTNVTRGSTTALETAVTAGPVVVAVAAGDGFFRHYESGVIRYCDDDVDHFALLVGYGTTADGNDYWLLQNSWGTGWGEDGYFRVSKSALEPEEFDWDGDGTTDYTRVRAGTCGILTHGAYPVLPAPAL